MVDIKFFPAIGEQFVSAWKRKMVYNEKDLKFFTNNSHFNYNFALQSAYYGLTNSKGYNYKDLIDFKGENKILMGDSGGFQLASFSFQGKKIDIKPLECLNWLEDNVDIAMNLDVPPDIFSEATYETFNKALYDSKNYFKLFEENRKNYKMWLYNVLHGSKIPLMELWYNEVKDFKFDGWAIGVRPVTNPFILALGFMFLHNKGECEKENIKGIHFFGTTGKHVVPTLVYISNKIKRNIFFSYDSSSYNTGSIYRKYSFPYFNGPDIYFGEQYKNENPEIINLPCDCPVCSNITDINLLNDPVLYAGVLLSLHNMYQYINYNKILNILVKNRQLFLQYLRSINVSEKTLISLDFIDYYFEYGLNKAMEKYKNYFDEQNINKCKQVNIFNF